MMSYCFKRRAFLGAIGGAFGLETLLRNLEAAAQGASSPPRLLIAQWPLGTVRYHFLPTGPSTGYTTSRILQPFDALGLRDDMIVLYGLSPQGLSAMGGGGAEAGTVFTMTGVSSPGTRENGGEADDAVAGGPSFDQIFLRNVPNLQSAKGYANVICDARVDSHEISSQCLSYSYETQLIPSAYPGGDITENKPLLPLRSPLLLFNELFSGFVPGQAMDVTELERRLRLKQSVLDSALRELARLGELAPASSREMIEIHAEAIRSIERQLSDALSGLDGQGCTPPGAPLADLEAKSGSSVEYGDPVRDEDESAGLAQLGKAFAGILRAAFQCDLLRVATFQWMPSTNHVAFAGLNPADPEHAYMHHPMSHRITSRSDVMVAPPAPEAPQAPVVEFLTNVHTWLNQKTAEILADFKQATDVFGNPLLDYTVVPFVTDKAEATDSRSPQPALILGGRALGMQGGQYLNLETAVRPQNDFWLTVAQAFFPDRDPLQALAEEKFVTDGGPTGPISGLWLKPG